jgi:hypothetical protein
MTRRDESVVLACMAYVDLNPIRAKMETTPVTSKHTSIRNRIQALIKGEQPKNLMRFVGNHRQDMTKGMAYSLIDYCELLDCTGRCIREDKAGYIEQHHSPILARLGLDSEQWLTLTTEFEQHFSTAVGSEHMLQQFKHHTNHQRIRGMAKARVLLQSAWTVQLHTHSKLLASQPVLNGVACNLSRRNDLAAFKTHIPQKLRFRNLTSQRQNISITFCLLIWLWLGTLLFWVSSLGQAFTFMAQEQTLHEQTIDDLLVSIKFEEKKR